MLRDMVDRKTQLAKPGTDVRVAHMNCTHNDPPAWLEVHQYPKLIFSFGGETETHSVRPNDFEAIGQEVRKRNAAAHQERPGGSGRDSSIRAEAKPVGKHEEL